METDELRTLADSNLDHVLIALRANDRAFNFRNVLDPWWVFERGGVFVHQRKDGGFSPHTFNNPCAWAHRERLPRFDWLSVGAKRILVLGREARIVDRKRHPVDLRLIADHSVPFAVIAQELWRDPLSWSRDSLRIFLLGNFKRAILSYHEDRQLTEAGFRNRMPEGWKSGRDSFARYQAAGINGFSYSQEK